jgi:hypothetical protein
MIRREVVLHIQGDGVQMGAEVLCMNERIVCAERMEEILSIPDSDCRIWRQNFPPKRRYKVFLHGVTRVTQNRPSFEQ